LDGHGVVDAEDVGGLVAGFEGTSALGLDDQDGIGEVDRPLTNIGIDGFGYHQGVSAQVATHLANAGFAVRPLAQRLEDGGGQGLLEGQGVDDGGGLVGVLDVGVQLFPLLHLGDHLGEQRGDRKGGQLGGQGGSSLENEGALVEAEQVEEDFPHHAQQDLLALAGVELVVFQQRPEAVVFGGIDRSFGRDLNFV